MNNSIKNYIQHGKELIEQKLSSLYTDANIPKNLKASMEYSLLAGGKRLRPILLLASYQSFHKTDEAKTLRTAAALEMIHTYSLIHDDLPAMDDDNYRRGALTNHKKFDEATAILAGDALLTNSFELIAKDELLTAEEKVFLITELSHASGPEGMVAGQVLDMEGEMSPLSLEELEKVHEHKTGKLISFAIIAGAYLGNATETQLTHLKKFAYYLGIIFQVQDDILDVIGDQEKLGKPIGSDEENKKSTYPNLLGLEGAKNHLTAYTEKALHALQEANIEQSYLEQLLYYFGERDH
ncbi:polyprenyl synthetase family protein [Pseudogracilibacillus sp. ICA-222130]|uniref:polyprenyl synthetase family protein n=1 Tax=Pseudogracilibacillus sp. ICA-222130 TaxID=3134655 RepID=UPI0030C4EF1B